MKKASGSLTVTAVTFFIITILFFVSANTVSAAQINDRKFFTVEAESAMLEAEIDKYNKTVSGNTLTVQSGTEVTVIADKKRGYAIAGWQVTAYSGKYSEITPYTANGYSFQLSVYDYNFKIKPVYKKLKYNATFYSCALITEEYKAFSEGNGSFTVNADYGSTVEVRAVRRTGYVLKKWEITAENDEGKSVKEIPAENDSLTIQIDCCNYEAVPIYEKEKFNLHVSSADITVSGAELYRVKNGYENDVEWNTDITLTANEIYGKSFFRWNISGLILTEKEAGNKKITFSMPLGDVRINALYRDIAAEDSDNKAETLVQRGNTALNYITCIKMLFIISAFLILFAAALYSIIKKSHKN